MGIYAFNTDRFTIDELADGLLVTCQDCNEWYARFAPAGAPSSIGTELLLHRLKCETGLVERQIIFAMDTWKPKFETWPAYEQRIRETFKDTLKQAGLLNAAQCSRPQLASSIK